MKKLPILVLLPVVLSSGFLLTKSGKTGVPVKKRTGKIEKKQVQLYDSTVTAVVTPQITDNLFKKQRVEIVKYATKLLGTPYVYAGMSPTGFDCSGFTTYVFSKFDIKIPHSSAMQAKEGKPVKRQEAKPGDLVIFTGTDPSTRKPGHVGIVISSPGDTISFVHSSSNGGVKISKVKGTRYDLRFLCIRRVL